MFHRLKQFVPEPLLQIYHYCLARLACFWYGNPSNELIVIGVTGTNGKTTTSYLISKALEASGHKTGCTTTGIWKIAEKETINNKKMTMPGRFFLQRMLREMVNAGCRYAVIETSSQGLIQHRHIGINYDVAVFTNLRPEHIEAHGGFENYKRAKRILFEHLVKQPVKAIEGKRIEKQAILNADSEHANYYAGTPGLKNVRWFSIDVKKGLIGESIELRGNGSRFTVEGAVIDLKLPGRYNVENALAVLAVCKALSVAIQAAATCLSAVDRVPGRFERIDIGQPFTVIIDYAPEPGSLQRLYETLSLIPHRRLIHILGSAGGGRDIARRPVLGKLAGEKADIVIITNEDPYDDDPKLIIDQVAAGAVEAAKKDGETLFRIMDRREAIEKAIQLAQPQDLVVMTGKGCEAWICVANGKKIPWDEVAVAKEAIKKVTSNS